MAKRAGGGAPGGIGAEFSSVWRLALKALEDQGTWQPQMRPLLDEYAFALEAAETARLADEQTQWDRHVKRAAALADQLALTPRGRKAAGIVEDASEPGSPFAAFLKADELSARRQAR